MNKLVLKGLVSCVFMSQILAVAAQDPETILKGLLGEYADVKPVCTTPVKTKVVRGDIVSPTLKNAILSLRKLQAALETTKEEAQHLSEEVETQKTTMKTLQDKVNSLTDDSKQKQTQIEMLQANIGKMENIQKLLLEKYKELAAASGSLETATILKMRITEEIQNIKQGFLIPEAKVRYEGIEYISYRYTVESVALKLVTSIDTEEKRATIDGLTELYNSIFRALNTLLERSSFELSAESKTTLLGIFNSILERELQGLASSSIPSAKSPEEDPMSINLDGLTE